MMWGPLKTTFRLVFDFLKKLFAMFCKGLFFVLLHGINQNGFYLLKIPANKEVTSGKIGNKRLMIIEWPPHLSKKCL